MGRFAHRIHSLSENREVVPAGGNEAIRRNRVDGRAINRRAIFADFNNAITFRQTITPHVRETGDLENAGERLSHPLLIQKVINLLTSQLYFH